MLIRNQNENPFTVKIIDDVDKIMIYCGFDRNSNRKDIYEGAFESFENIISLTEKDIVNLSKWFLDSTADNERIAFRLFGNIFLKSMVHWV